ncbi:MAG: hypothetical protein HGA98_02025 [Deltaproteobacteria bacterium]|nr:hypothetical protein [Deltaproteobacteria bacterium]
MGVRSWVGVVLIAAGLVLGAAGFRKSELSTGEKVAEGFAGIAAALDPTGNRDLQRTAKDLARAGFRRALPYYAGGGLAVAAGAVVLFGGRKRG